MDAYVQAGFVMPAAAGEDRVFSFQDLLLLRTARRLAEAVPHRRVLGALARLRSQLPGERQLTELTIELCGNEIVARDGTTTWHPESGQTLLDFGSSGSSDEPAPRCATVSPLAPRAATAGGRPFSAEDDEIHDPRIWYELGDELEDLAPDDARDAYRRALELDPYHVEARVNLGRLLHEAGLVAEAMSHYQLAHGMCPTDPTPSFNLGVALQDLGRPEAAVNAYRAAIEADSGCADAHYNAARLCEQLGRHQEALEHLARYRLLVDP